MTRTVFSCFLILALTTSWSHAQSNTKWTEATLQQMYIKHLDDAGITGGFVDSDGDVQFKYNDRNYFVEVNENDLEFFRVVLFNIWPIESATESAQAALAVNEVNKELKVVKAYITNSDNVWMACELFVGEPDAFRPVFDRCLKVIDDGVDTFVDKM